MNEPTSIQREMTVAADPATVFAFFTDSNRLVRWLGVAATLEPQPGGLFLVDVTGGNVARGEFKEVVPVSRLAFSFGWNGNDHLPPGSSLVEIDLQPINGSTLLRFTHSGLPPELVPDHAEGWGYYLPRLAIAVTGGDPGPNRPPRGRRS